LPKLKDTDYLSISARIRAMENRLLTHERMERMLEARSNDEAVKVLSECGYGDFSAATPAAMEEKLVEARNATYKDLRSAVPDPGFVDIFRIKYDYHNAKVLLKSEAVGADAARLLVEGGRYPAAALREAYNKEDLRN
jgi:V/A-type H+-transporting ATPase subunit C